jgi:hypothetical protein
MRTTWTPADIVVIQASLAILRIDSTQAVVCPIDGGRIRPETPFEPEGVYVFCEGQCHQSQFIYA